MLSMVAVLSSLKMATIRALSRSVESAILLIASWVASLSCATSTSSIMCITSCIGRLVIFAIRSKDFSTTLRSFFTSSFSAISSWAGVWCVWWDLEYGMIRIFFMRMIGVSKNNDIKTEHNRKVPLFVIINKSLIYSYM